MKANSDIIKLVQQVPTEWNLEKALAGATNALQAHPEINVIFMHSDYLLGASISALRQAGRYKKIGETGHVIVMPYSGNKASIDAMKDGYVEMTFGMDVYKEGYDSVKAAVELVKGKTYGKPVLDAGFIITQENFAPDIQEGLRHLLMKGSNSFEPGVSRLTPGSPVTAGTVIRRLVSAAREIFGRMFSLVERMSMLFFVVYFLFCLLFVNKFANPVNLGNMLVQCADLIILACGMTFVFMNGGIDFSVTATLALGSILGAKVMTMGGDPLVLTILGVAVMLAIGLGIGALNGLTVTAAAHAVIHRHHGDAAHLRRPRAVVHAERHDRRAARRRFSSSGRGTLFGVQMPIFIMLVVVAVTAFVLHRTVLGRYIFSVGTNHRTSLISGIPVKKTIFSLFLFSGGLAAISGIIMTSRSGAGMPALGKSMLMDIVGAVVIGGTSVTGGSGSILGTAIGAVLIIVLNNSLNLLGIEWYVINALKGVMITLVALLSVLRTANEPVAGIEVSQTSNRVPPWIHPFCLLKQLNKSFSGVQVLKDIDLTLGRKGSILGLVGENGAGKSTMMNILGRNIAEGQRGDAPRREAVQPEERRRCRPGGNRPHPPGAEPLPEHDHRREPVPERGARARSWACSPTAP